MWFKKRPTDPDQTEERGPNAPSGSALSGTDSRSDGRAGSRSVASGSGAIGSEATGAQSSKNSEPAKDGRLKEQGSRKAGGTASAPISSRSSAIEGLQNAPTLSPLEQRCGRLRSALGPGTEVQGRLSFDSPVSLDGNLKGMVRSTELIAVSENAKVDVTSIVAKALVVAGNVKAEDAQLTERLEVLPGGRFIGNVEASAIVIAEGGIFDGQSRVRPSNATGLEVSRTDSASITATTSGGSASAVNTANTSNTKTSGKSKKVSVEELIN